MIYANNRKSITTKRIGEGWRKLKVERGGTHLEGAFKTKQQITVELTFPFIETISIDTTEPFADSDDLASFAEELALVVEHRRKVRRKQKLVENKELLRTKILPQWFEREAFIARNNAEKEDIRKQARRELNAGKVELKEYNDLVRTLKGRSDDDDFIDGLADYNRRLIIALGALDVEKGFRLSQHDLRDILGRNAWEQSLQIHELDKDVKDSTLHIIARGVENFNRLYNLDPQAMCLGQMRSNYDSITIAGFGDIILAAALKKGGEVVAVMAIDDVQGRRALRHLLGAERLAEVLPKRAYNAVMRDERLLLGDAVASDSIEHEMIIIE
jgi:hypothetical protein